MGCSSPLFAGQVLGGFRVTGEIGRGSCAAVYAAEQEATGEEVALKWMLEEVEVPTLKREFRIARALSHPHLVRLREMHHDGDGVYFTMERIRGGNVVARVREVTGPTGRVSLAQRLFSQLADALHYLHAAALVHRDVKPSNVLVDDRDRVVVVDFGLTKPVAADSSAGFSGTYAYAAPERLRGRPATPSSDWFAFGVLLFEALAGELPWGPDARATIAAWLAGQRIETEKRLPVEAGALAPLLDGLLEPTPERRAGPSQVFSTLGRPGHWAIAHTLVGRDEAREWLAAHLSNETRLLAVTGPPGSGKTTLVRRALEASRGDCLVLASQCHPRESVPFNALDGAVGELLEHARSRSSESHPERLLLEQVFERAGALTAGTTPEAIAAALSSLMASFAPERGVVLLIDDVQWADRDSVPLVEHLLASTPRLRCVLIARGDASQIPAPLRPPPERRLELASLDTDASTALLRQLAPDLDAARVLALSRLGDGQPLALEQAAGWALSEPDAAVPASFGELMVGIAANRSEAHRDLLALLAVHAHGLDSDVLLACRGTSLSPAYDLLDAGLVEFERSAHRYRLGLRHEQIADAVRATLTEDRRRAHHLRLADAFEQARPGDDEALFLHLWGAGDLDRAREPALRSARALRTSLAFHRAAERYRWLLSHSTDDAHGVSLGRELAETLGQAGEATEAGEAFLELVARAADEGERRELRRAASEQLLRAGDAQRGRALLDQCLRDAGIAIPRGRTRQILAVVAERFRIRRRRLRTRSDRTPDQTTTAELDLTWSAGLGLNLVDIIASSLAQARFTELALREGSPEQVARAVAVEYSYTMLAGGLLSGRRGGQLRHAMDELVSNVSSPYARAMVDLSWAAGDFFRGRLDGVEERIASATTSFERSFGAKSWELANCGMYASWAALERGDLADVAARIPALLRISTSRGDALYRQCFIGGYGATAWLIGDRADELSELLDSLPVPRGSFQMPHFFELLARTRLDMYRGDPRSAWRRIARQWPEIRRSGFLFLRWLRLVLGVVAVQAALGARGEPGARAMASSWIPKIARIDHPAARPWSTALRAALLAPERPRAETFAELADAELGFADAGFQLSALGARHHRGLLGDDVSVDWSAAVSCPDALATAIMFAPISGASSSA